ncbi:hypothetical protein BC940DRAFT_292504 [Gongronella butleri]|nr:hypothetical protein BC940DRAFT_292504 [Gongronella butleri]
MKKDSLDTQAHCKEAWAKWRDKGTEILSQVNPKETARTKKALNDVLDHLAQVLARLRELLLQQPSDALDNKKALEELVDGYDQEYTLKETLVCLVGQGALTQHQLIGSKAVWAADTYVPL